jgi:hypothetical protein
MDDVKRWADSIRSAEAKLEREQLTLSEIRVGRSRGDEFSTLRRISELKATLTEARARLAAAREAAARAEEAERRPRLMALAPERVAAAERFDAAAAALAAAWAEAWRVAMEMERVDPEHRYHGELRFYSAQAAMKAADPELTGRVLDMRVVVDGIPLAVSERLALASLLPHADDGMVHARSAAE